MAKDDPVAMTPVAAVVRHVEWLEFALAAARDEETRRRDRLAQATDKNRGKRTARLAEVSAEVRELGALVQGLKNLQARQAVASRSAGTRRRSPAAAKSRTSSKAATGARPAAAAAATPKPTTAAKSSSPAAKASAAKPKAAAAKPKAIAAKPKTARSTKPRASSAKPAATRAAKPATRRRAARPSAPS
jgi:translation initiation factor IF-3